MTGSTQEEAERRERCADILENESISFWRSSEEKAVGEHRIGNSVGAMPAALCAAPKYSPIRRIWRPRGRSVTLAALPDNISADCTHVSRPRRFRRAGASLPTNRAKYDSHESQGQSVPDYVDPTLEVLGIGNGTPIVAGAASNLRAMCYATAPKAVEGKDQDCQFEHACTQSVISPRRPVIDAPRKRHMRPVRPAAAEEMSHATSSLSPYASNMPSSSAANGIGSKPPLQLRDTSCCGYSTTLPQSPKLEGYPSSTEVVDCGRNILRCRGRHFVHPKAETAPIAPME